MTRRITMYAEARNTPHQYGEQYVVTSMFCDLCGILDIGFRVGELASFSSWVIENVKFIKSHRISL